jgi:hypothetical protein
MAMRFRPEPEAVQRLLEPARRLVGSDISDDDNWAWCWAVETLLPEVEDPFYGEFWELAVGIPCFFRGERASFFPYIWLDRPHPALLSGMLQGVAEISITPFHRLCRGLQAPRTGTRLKARASRNGEALVRAEMVLEQPSDWTELQPGFIHWLNIFHLPDPLRPGQNLIRAFTVAELSPESRFGPVWRAKANLEFGPADSGLLAALALREMGTCYYASIAYQYVSDRRLAG